MARRTGTRTEVDRKAALMGDEAFQESLRGAARQMLDAGMDRAVGAGPHERNESRVMGE